MIQREDFIFTVGYQGNISIVDGELKRKYGKLKPEELAGEGLFKAALCSALYSDNTEALDKILSIYNQNTAYPLKSVENLKRTFGVYKVPDGIGKVMVI